MTSKTQYKLLTELNVPRKSTCLPAGISYQEYTIEVEKQIYEIYIPLRECATFEKQLNESAEKFGGTTTDDFKNIMRHRRGIWR